MVCHSTGGGRAEPWLSKRIEIPLATFARLTGAAGLKFDTLYGN